MRDPFSGYDQWKTASPYDDWGWEENYPCYRCEECGCFLKNEPDKSIPGESRQEIEDIDGTINIEIYTWTDHHRTCKKCGHDNVVCDT